MKTRSAVSMIELLVIMSACTVAMTLTGVLLQRVMHIQMQSRAHVNSERSALRLSVQFRRDVHRSRTAVAGNAEGDKDVFLRLQLAEGRTVSYSRDGGTVLRIESGSRKPTWREQFAFSAVNELTIEEEDAPRRLILKLTTKPTEQPLADGTPPVRTHFVPLSICAEAVIGRELRFETAVNHEASE